MATLQVQFEGAEDVQILVNGTVYQFADGYLEVEDAVADEIRRQAKTLFPHLGIVVHADYVEPAPSAPDPGAQPEVTPGDPEVTQAPDAPEGDETDIPADPAPEAAPEVPAPAKPLEKMNLAELRELAAARGIDGDGLSKAQIRERLAA